jgi:thiamine biosynthesis lipoprotein
MGSQFEIILPAGRYPDALPTVLAAFDIVSEIEQKLSIFISESEISIVNAKAASEPVPVSDWVFRLLEESIQLAEETEGAFDITAGPLWRLWGFARKRYTVPSSEEIAQTLSAVGFTKILLDPVNRTVRFAARSMEINLGAIGKGYAVDKVAEFLRSQGIGTFLLSAGYSSIRACCELSGFDSSSLSSQTSTGTFASLSETPGQSSSQLERCVTSDWLWEVGVRDPIRPDRRATTLRLREAAVGTSGSALQYFRHEGRRFSHIIDPRSGWPVENIHAVTVLAPEAQRADALSTAFFVLGPEWAQQYCQRHPEIAALFAVARGTGPGYCWQAVGNWPADAFPAGGAAD